jgi:hypothetical protein
MVIERNEDQVHAFLDVCFGQASDEVVDFVPGRMDFTGFPCSHQGGQSFDTGLEIQEFRVLKRKILKVMEVFRDLVDQVLSKGVSRQHRSEFASGLLHCV